MNSVASFASGVSCDRRVMDYYYNPFHFTAFALAFIIFPHKNSFQKVQILGYFKNHWGYRKILEFFAYCSTFAISISTTWFGIFISLAFRVRWILFKF